MRVCSEYNFIKIHLVGHRDMTNSTQMISKHRGYMRNEKGLAALEFIIALPILLMLSVLVMDVGRALIQYTEINKALQNGVRYAVVDTYGTLDFGSIADETSIKNVVIYGTPNVTDTSVAHFSG